MPPLQSPRRRVGWAGEDVPTANVVVFCVLGLLFGTAGVFMVLSLLFALVRGAPLILVGLYFCKPRLESFVEYLLQAAKKGGLCSSIGAEEKEVPADNSGADSNNGSHGTSSTLRTRRLASTTATTAGPSPPPTRSSKGGGGWLMNMVSKTIKKTSAALFLNPVRDWLYLDLGILVLCKRKPRAFDGLAAAVSGTAARDDKVFALGVLFHWYLLDPSTVTDMDAAWPYRKYVYGMACLVSDVWPDEKWHAFSSLATKKRLKERRRSATEQAAAVEAAVATAVQHADEALTEVVLAAAAAATKAHAISPPPPMEESGAPGEGQAMRRHMQHAQELAERGRFEEAGKAVEFGLEKCRNVLRGGIEEQTELLVVASAFYEAGAPTSMRCSASRLRCLEEAAEMCVVQKRWAKASELFEECVLAWLEDRKKDSPHGLSVTGRCVLSAVFAQFMVGDTVKAEQFYRMVCVQDPKFKQTPEAVLIGGVLRGIRHHNPNEINEAKRSYKPKQHHRGDGKTLEHWQVQVMKHMIKRADATVLL